MPSRLAVVALLVAGPAMGQPSKRIELVERILAVVDDRPLFLSEVRTLGQVRRLDSAAALEAAIDERLMYAEAARLPQAEVAEEEVERALALLAETSPEVVSTVPAPELRRLLRRQATIVKYVEFRFRPQVRIAPAQVREAWERERAANGPGFEEAAPAVRARLERRAVDERIEEWVSDLRARAEVRYVPAEGSAPEGP